MECTPCHRKQAICKKKHVGLKENLCSFVGGWMDRYLKGIENQMKNSVMARNLLDTFDR